MFASREPKLEAWDRIWTSCEPRNGQPDRPRLLPTAPSEKVLAPEIGKETLASPASRTAAPVGSDAAANGGAGPKAAVSDSFLDPGEDDEFFDAREETTWQAREAQDAADKAEVEGEESDSDAEVSRRAAACCLACACHIDVLEVVSVPDASMTYACLSSLLPRPVPDRRLCGVQDGLAPMCLPFLKHPSARKSRKEAGPMACFTPRPSSPPRVPKDEGERPDRYP